MSRRNLSKTEIVEEAIRLLEEEGLERLSMRKLASRLGVQAPTLYYYIPDKSALLNEVLSVLFQRCLDRMPPSKTWQEWMRAFGEAIWEVQQEERFSPVLILTTQLDEEHFQQTLDRLHAELAKFDVDQEQAFFLQAAVQAIITGWSIFANASYSEKVGRFVDFKEAALSSIDALIESRAGKVSLSVPDIIDSPS